MRAVRFEEYGDVDVLQIVDVDPPEPAADGVVVQVRAAGINPGETAIRTGAMEDVYPTTFPCGEGSDFAGVVTAVGAQVDDIAEGDEVVGWTDERASHAELVGVPAEQVVARPDDVGVDVAATLYVAGMAGLASVEAVDPKEGETVVVSAAAGGTGLVSAQLAVARGATVIGLASASNHDWLRGRGIVPVEYGEGQVQRITDAAGGVPDAFIDCFGNGYVQLAIDMGIPTDRINTLKDFEAVERFDVSAQGTSEAASRENLQRLVDWVADGTLEIPIKATYALDDVRDAYRELDERSGLGKIVLKP